MLSTVAPRQTMVLLVRKTRMGKSGHAAQRSLTTRRTSETAPTQTGARKSGEVKVVVPWLTSVLGKRVKMQSASRARELRHRRRGLQGKEQARESAGEKGEPDSIELAHMRLL